MTDCVKNSVVGHPNCLQQNWAFVPNTELNFDMATAVPRKPSNKRLWRRKAR